LQRYFSSYPIFTLYLSVSHRLASPPRFASLRTDQAGRRCDPEGSRRAEELPRPTAHDKDNHAWQGKGARISF
jgi:hypothetical protein